MISLTLLSFFFFVSGDNQYGSKAIEFVPLKSQENDIKPSLLRQFVISNPNGEFSFWFITSRKTQQNDCKYKINNNYKLHILLLYSDKE